MDYEKFLKSLSVSNLKGIVNKHNEKLNIKLTNSKKESLIKFLLDHTEMDMKNKTIKLKEGIEIKKVDFENTIIQLKKDKVDEKNYLMMKQKKRKEKKTAREIGKITAEIENLKDEKGNEEYVKYDEGLRFTGISMTKKKKEDIDMKKIKEIDKKIKELQKKKKEQFKILKELE